MEEWKERKVYVENRKSKNDTPKPTIIKGFMHKKKNIWYDMKIQSEPVASFNILEGNSKYMMMMIMSLKLIYLWTWWIVILNGVCEIFVFTGKAVFFTQI